MDNAVRNETNAAAIRRVQPHDMAERHRDAAATSLKETRQAWPGLTVYERFEQVAALVITALVSVLIAAALLHLT